MMRQFCSVLCLLLIQPTFAAESIDRVLDGFADKLTLASSNGQFRAQVSGLLDLETYFYSGNPPALISDASSPVFQPRLSLFLDAQAGEKFYFFTQVRADRSFDPADKGLDLRLEEYALRFSPWTDRHFSIQAGQFATIAGQWTKRHLSWDNPFVSAPLFYEQPTFGSDRETYGNQGGYRGANKDMAYGGNPMIWGPAYTSGLAVSASWRQIEWAVSIKNAALMSRPEYWPVDEVGFDEPTFTGRVAWRPDLRWTLGLSASRGAYLGPSAQYALPYGIGRGDFVQTVWLADLSYEHRHLQIWAEAIYVTLDSPFRQERGTSAYFLEARYKFAPRLSVAARWNQQFFSDLDKNSGYSAPGYSYLAEVDPVRWGPEQSRVDLAVTWRFNAHMQVQLELNSYWGANARSSPTAAIRWTARF